MDKKAAKSKTEPFSSQLPGDLKHRLRLYAVSTKRRVHEVLAEAVLGYLKRQEGK